MERHEQLTDDQRAAALAEALSALEHEHAALALIYLDAHNELEEAEHEREAIAGILVRAQENLVAVRRDIAEMRATVEALSEKISELLGGD